MGATPGKTLESHTSFRLNMPSMPLSRIMAKLFGRLSVTPEETEFHFDVGYTAA
jgi:hypothetical protein